MIKFLVTFGPSNFTQNIFKTSGMPNINQHAFSF